MYQMVLDTIVNQTTDFYFKALFNFPEITGPQHIAMGILPSIYTLPKDNNLSYYWQVDGGKIVPGIAQNKASVVWLVEKEGRLSVILVHKNQASVEIKVPVVLP